MEILLYEKIFFMTSLYLLQGIILGCLMGLTPLIFSTSLSISKLASLQTIKLPFSLKLFIAPFVDLNPFGRFGKHRSVIVLSIILIIPLFYFLSNSYLSTKTDTPLSTEGSLKNINLDSLIFYSFLIILLTAFKDIALDSFCLDLFDSESESHYGALCQTVGQTVGDLIVTIGYTFYTNEIDDLTSFGNFLKVVPIFSFIMLLFVIFSETLKKAEIKQKEKPTLDLIKYFKKVKHLLANKNLMYLFFLVMTYRLGMAFFDDSFTIEIIKLGFPKERINQISIFAVFLNILISLYFENQMNSGGLSLWIDFLKKKIKFSLISLAALFYIKNNGTLKDVFYFPQINPILVNLCLFGIIVVISTLNNVMFTIMFSFMNKLCDSEIGGLYITMFASILNFSSISSSYLQMRILGFLEEKVITIGVLSILYSVLWVMRFEETVLRIGKLKGHNWHL